MSAGAGGEPADKSFELGCLTGPARVVIDRWGVPHVYAADEHDLFALQGFVHAHDRLWQMELRRRLGTGRLAEILGAGAVATDRFVRIVGLNRMARADAALLEGDAQEAVAAYTAGVNAYLERGDLPLELEVLGVEPEPWTDVDVVATGKVLALTLCGNWAHELVRAAIVHAVGAQRASELGFVERDAELVWPTAAAAPAHTSGRLRGSNAWAVAGSRSESGKPLLACDPHLPLEAPSVWYENHLVGGRYAVTGASITGLPGVVVGHNERVAWGVTNAPADVQDLYVERFDPTDPLLYEYRDGWERAEVVAETIRVRDESPLVEEVRVTRHGPVVTDLAPGFRAPQHHELALRWTAATPGRLCAALLALNRTSTWDEFRTALEGWTEPPLNVVYADADGTIGRLLAGTVPVRARASGRLPVAGWTGEDEWVSMLAPDALPAVADPADGIVVSANDEPERGDLDGEWASPYRAARIRELLLAKERHEVGSFTAIQLDTRSLPGLRLRALHASLPAATEVAAAAREALRAWDGDVAATSVGATVYARLRRHLVRTATREVADELAEEPGLGTTRWDPGLDLLDDAVLPRILDRLDGGDDDAVGLLAQAWAKTVAELEAERGADVTTWRYGRVHRFTIRHALADHPRLAKLVSHGPYPLAGDADTVRAAHLESGDGDAAAAAGVTYRQICDTSDWDRSVSILIPGQSGRRGSAHYADLVPLWFRDRYHPMLWSRDRVEAEAGERWELVGPPRGRPRRRTSASRG